MDDSAVSAAGIDLLLGPPNAGKMGKVMSWWAAHRAASPVLVVPSRADVSALTAELVGRVGAVFGPRPVITMDELGEEILGERRVIAGELEQLVLIRHLLAEQQPAGLGEVAELPGTASAILTVLRELSESSHDPAEVGSLLREGGEAEPGSVSGDLGRIWDAYQGELAEAGMVDRSGPLRAAAASAEEWSRPVGCYGFSSFTPAQRRLLEKLAERVPVLISLSHEEGRPGAHRMGSEVAWGRKRAVRVRILPAQDGVFGAPDLARLERGFMRSGPVADRAGDEGRDEKAGVRFLLAAGRRNEAEQAAREILRLLADGYGADDIALLVRSVEPWRRTLSRVFRAYGIPHRLDARTSLRQTGLGRSLLSALLGWATGEVEPILSYLRGPYSGISREEVDAFEKEATAEARGWGEKSAERLQEVFPDAVGRMEAVLDEQGAEEPLLDPAALTQLAWDMVVAAAREVGGASAPGEEDMQAYSVVFGACEQLRRAGNRGWHEGFGSAKATLSSMAELPVWLGRGDERGVVRVMSAGRARARRFPVVFVLGLTDGEFPQRQSTPALLDARTRRHLNAAAEAELLPEPEPGEEVALFHHVLSRPKNLLYLSARNSGDTGEEAMPSPFWEEARATLGGRRIWRRRGLDEVAGAADQALTRREYLRACAAHGGKPAEEEDGWLLEAKAEIAGAGGRGYSAAVRAFSAGRTVFSAGELETYHQCPFRWFLEKGLRLDDLDSSSLPLVRGNLLHAVLEQVYRHLITTGSLPLDASGRVAAGEVAEKVLRQHLDRTESLLSGGDRRLLEREIGRMVGRFLDLETGGGSAFVPARTEHRLPADGVEVAEGLRLRGRIDRIDLRPGGEEAFVVDYKSGSPTRAKDFARNGSLQLTLYILALRSEWPEVDVSGGAYAFLRSGKVLGLVAKGQEGQLSPGLSGLKGRSREEIEDEIGAGLEAAEKAAAGIRRGKIAAEPLGGECPQFCSWGPLCRAKGGA